jgi:hypothetical protein
MPPTTIVSDDVLLRLLSAGATKLGSAKAHASMEQAFGYFDPSPELLRNTIDAVFWASLSAEEGRPSLTRVQFTDIRDPQCRLGPRDISAAELRKLSPFMDEPSNVLYVRNDGKIIGVGSSSGGVGVVAHRPGRLAVLEGVIVLGVFDQGDWVIIGGSETNFSQILQRALPDESFPERFLKATLIVRLAMAARRTRRGATFVLVPADRQIEGIGSISYPVEAFPALPQALDAWRQARRITPPTAEKSQIRIPVDIASAVAAAGAGIDGATLIEDSSLRLLGFGAKISAPDDDLEIGVMELPNTVVRMIKKKNLGGMRHQTAARLVQLNNDAMVITVSQDGPISLFTWVRNEAAVIVLKHLDRYLAADIRF